MSRQQLSRALLLSLFVFTLFCITTLALPTGHTGDLATLPGTAIIPWIVPTMDIFDLKKRQYGTYPVNSTPPVPAEAHLVARPYLPPSVSPQPTKFGLGVGIPGALAFFVTVYMCIRDHRKKGGKETLSWPNLLQLPFTMPAESSILV